MATSLPRGTQHAAPLHIIKQGEVNLALGFDLVGGGVPGDGGSAEIGLICHVASERGVVAEDGVFGNLLMIASALEKSPEVGLFSVPGFAAIAESLPDGFLAWLGIVLLVPLS